VTGSNTPGIMGAGFNRKRKRKRSLSRRRRAKEVGQNTSEVEEYPFSPWKKLDP